MPNTAAATASTAMTRVVQESLEELVGAFVQITMLPQFPRDGLNCGGAVSDE